MINDSEIDALAKGMVPFVRECVTEAMTPLATRLAELDARPIEKGDAGPPGPEGPTGPKGENGAPASMNEVVPPEIAEQVKTAIHLLHESPPIVQHNPPPRSALPLPPARPSRIERNANGGYTLIYDEPQP